MAHGIVVQNAMVEVSVDFLRPLSTAHELESVSVHPVTETPERTF